MENLLLATACLGCLGCIPHHEVKRSGCSLTEAGVAIERNGDADGGILAGELKPSFEQTVVNLIDVKRAALFAQQQRHRLGNGAIHKTITYGFDVWPQAWNLLTPGIHGEG